MSTSFNQKDNTEGLFSWAVVQFNFSACLRNFKHGSLCHEMFSSQRTHKLRYHFTLQINKEFLALGLVCGRYSIKVGFLLPDPLKMLLHFSIHASVLLEGKVAGRGVI